jgi:formylglycine-generating enzyme required for sulfatase activity
VEVGAFLIDSHEQTEGEYAECVATGPCPPAPSRGEPGLPQARITAEEAETYCRFREGRLPTDDELAFATMGSEGRRYPWGETGAVCRRVAFGLEQGPCAHDSGGPQLAGSHSSGATADGIHDLAGNVAEWTRPIDGVSSVRGGSWRDVGAEAVRAWSFVRLDPGTRSPAVGFRCVYEVAPPRPSP